jgi:sodium transport system permease protein
MNRLFKVIYRKEMKDMTRDKRALYAIASYVVGVPLLMGFIFYLMADDRGESARTVAAVAGAADAPGLVAFLEKRGLEVVETARPEEVPGRLPDGADAFLVLPEEFSAKLGRGYPVPVQLYVDETSRTQAERGGEVSAALAAYSQQIAGIRLTARGVPLSLMAPIAVNTSDLAPASFTNKMLGNSLMLIFMLAPFVMGMSVALDALAGERERQSLQSLMAQPVGAVTVVAGKWAMVSTFAGVGTLLVMTIDMALLQFVPADYLPFKVQLTPLGAVLVAVEVAVLSMFVASLLLTVSIHAKSFKEGQTYMSMMMMVPVVVGYAKMYGESKLPAVMNYLPFFADLESLARIFFDGAPNVMVTAAAILSCLAGSAVCLWLTARRLSSEQMLSEA